MALQKLSGFRGCRPVPCNSRRMGTPIGAGEDHQIASGAIPDVGKIAEYLCYPPDVERAPVCRAGSAVQYATLELSAARRDAFSYGYDAESRLYIRRRLRPEVQATLTMRSAGARARRSTSPPPSSSPTPTTAKCWNMTARAARSGNRLRCSTKPASTVTADPRKDHFNLD